MQGMLHEQVATVRQLYAKLPLTSASSGAQHAVGVADTFHHAVVVSDDAVIERSVSIWRAN